MKLNEVLNEEAALKRPDYSWANLLKALYAYVAKTLPLDGRWKEEAKELMRTTDQFHPIDFEIEVQKALAKEGHFEVREAIRNAIEEIGTKIHDYFDQPMNHAPGYKKPPAWRWVIADNVSDADADAIIKAAEPKLMDYFQHMNDEEDAADESKLTSTDYAAFKKEFESKFDESLADYAKMIAKDRHAKTPHYKPDNYWGLEGITQEELDAIKKPADFAKAFLKTDPKANPFRAGGAHRAAFKGGAKLDTTVAMIYNIILEHPPILKDMKHKGQFYHNKKVQEKAIALVKPFIEKWLKTNK